MDLIPKPDQVVSAASNVAHKVLYGGVADLRHHFRYEIILALLEPLADHVEGERGDPGPP